MLDYNILSCIYTLTLLFYFVVFIKIKFPMHSKYYLNVIYYFIKNLRKKAKKMLKSLILLVY